MAQHGAGDQTVADLRAIPALVAQTRDPDAEPRPVIAARSVRKPRNSLLLSERQYPPWTKYENRRVGILSRKDVECLFDRRSEWYVEKALKFVACLLAFIDVDSAYD
jgi:hypothetical protein